MSSRLGNKLRRTILSAGIMAAVITGVVLAFKLFGFIAEVLDEEHLKELVLYNFFFFSGLALSSLVFIRLRKKRIFRETFGSIMSRKRAAISFYTILFYFAIGALHMIYIPKYTQGPEGKNVRTHQTLLDFAFSGTPTETTYSAPLATTTIDGKTQVQGTHLLGTDRIGVDVLALTAKGASTALIISFGSCLIIFPLAILLGISSGYFGGFIDDLIIWLYTTITSMPFLLFIIALIVVWGRSLGVIVIAFGLTSWVGTCRLLRGETLKNKELPYVQASLIQGASHLRIILKHILPNVSHILVIQFALISSGLIITESILSFLGIGLDAADGSWGAMITQAQEELIREPTVWWQFVAASFLGIFPLVLALNIFGDVTRDALDPKLKGELVG